MVEPWWKTNYWLWVKGRPGSVFCVSVSMQHSIMGLNHPLPTLRWAAAVLSRANWVTLLWAWAAVAREGRDFSFLTASNAKSIWVSAEGKEFRWPRQIIFTQMTLQDLWGEKQTSPLRFKVRCAKSPIAYGSIYCKINVKTTKPRFFFLFSFHRVCLACAARPRKGPTVKLSSKTAAPLHNTPFKQPRHLHKHTHTHTRQWNYSHRCS